MNSHEDNVLLNVSIVAASHIHKYILKRVSVRRLRKLNVKVSVVNFEKRIFEIDIDVECDLGVKQEILNKLVNDASEYGFNLIKYLLEKIDNGEVTGTLNEIERIARKFRQNSHSHT